MAEKVDSPTNTDSTDLVYPIQDPKMILEGELESMTEKFELMTEKNKVTGKNLRNVKLTLNNTQNRNSMLKNENTEHLKDLASMSKRNNELRDSTKTDRETITKLEAEKTKSGQENTRLKEDLKKMKGEKRTVDQKNKSLKKKLQELMKLNETLSKEKETLQESVTKLTDAHAQEVSSLKESVASHKETVSVLENSNKELQQSSKEILIAKNLEVHESKELQRELSHQYVRFEKDNERLRIELNKVDIEKKDLLLSRNVLEREVERLRGFVVQKSSKKKCLFCKR